MIFCITVAIVAAWKLKNNKKEYAVACDKSKAQEFVRKFEEEEAAEADAANEERRAFILNGLMFWP